MFFSTVIFGNNAYDWKMTPTPRSRAGSSVTSLPCRITLPVYGISKPAMMRRIVVLPLPEAPSNTSTSPSATSKLMFSSTLALPNCLTESKYTGSGRRRRRVRRRFNNPWNQCLFSLHHHASVDIQPIACQKQHAEISETKKARGRSRSRLRLRSGLR